MVILAKQYIVTNPDIFTWHQLTNTAYNHHSPPTVYSHSLRYYTCITIICQFSNQFDIHNPKPKSNSKKKKILSHPVDTGSGSCRLYCVFYTAVEIWLFRIAHGSWTYQNIYLCNTFLYNTNRLFRTTENKCQSVKGEQPFTVSSLDDVFDIFFLISIIIFKNRN